MMEFDVTNLLVKYANRASSIFRGVQHYSQMDLKICVSAVQDTSSYSSTQDCDILHKIV